MKNSVGGRRSRFVVCLAVLVISLLTIPVRAQDAPGTILGVVKDSSGGAVPGAKITAINTGTADTKTQTTGDDGAYRFPGMRAANYTIKVEKDGFSTQSQTGLTLNVASDLVVNVTLQVGTAAQEVTVTGEAPVINTSNSSMGGLVSQSTISELPLNGRNYIDLTLLQPGIALHQNHSGNNWGTWYSSNGAPPGSNSVRLDGAQLNRSQGGTSSGISGATLGADGIQEYKVVTGAYGAEYGQTMGSQTMMVSKSGTNSFHGTAFDYLRNAALDARNFFDYGYQSPAGRRLPGYVRNNFGGSFGGPIKKDKTFFFSTFEGLKQNQGFTVNDTVLTAGCHNLVASGQPDGSFRFATAADALACNNGKGGLTTSTVVPKVMKPLIDLWPLPNLPDPNNASNATLNNRFTFAAPSLVTIWYGQIRVDHTFSNADSIFGRVTIDDTVQDTPSGVQTAASGVAFPGYRIAGTSRDQFWTLGENHVFGPSLLNSLRISFSRTNGGSNNSYPTPPPIGPDYSFRTGYQIGQIRVNGGLSAFASALASGGRAPKGFALQNIYTVSDDLFHDVGKHALKFGFLLNKYNLAQDTLASTPLGQLLFGSTANLVQGLFQNYINQTSGFDGSVFFRWNTFGVYLQDDWRATTKLTLNLGLRYEFFTVPREDNGKEYRLTDLYTQSVPTQGPIVRNPSYRNFSPRIGFAYDVFGDGKTAVRGGFALYYDVGNITRLVGSQFGSLPPITASATCINPCNPDGLNPAPVGLQVLTLPFKFPAAGAAAQLSTTDYNIQQVHSLQYSLGVERQLPGSISLGVAYVGYRGINLWQVREGNPTIETSVTNGVPFWGPAVALCENNFVNGVSCRSNPKLLDMTLATTAGNSFYNSLQVSFNKRVSHGLQFGTSYTYSQSIDNTQSQGNSSDCFVGTGGITNPLDPNRQAYDRGASCFNTPHVFRFNMQYHFPNTKADFFGAKLLHGWSMSNIVSLQKGYPFNVLLNANHSRSGVNGNRADRVNLNTADFIAQHPCTSLPGQPPPPGANPCAYVPIPFNPETAVTGNPQQWFNPAMFSIPDAGFLGNSSRSQLRGPGLENWDFSIVKDTALPFLGEAGSLQFRTEVFNVLNKANFGMPTAVVFAGNAGTPFAESPGATAGNIGATATASRQIQFALRLVF